MEENIEEEEGEIEVVVDSADDPIRSFDEVFQENQPSEEDRTAENKIKNVVKVISVTYLCGKSLFHLIFFILLIVALIKIVFFF